ncbi:hypothetical protein CXB51_021954 [Gossypium anomalum]|uniref:Uncharacterized protein n=1 Tax=Gossypium anomalum TaxID=47600 RepID=A0A8J5YJF2_9ROSI|nr:hypothetical protein CXB51_021954 [Gossypium anomalum]
MKYELVSNNSMALRIRYEILFFQNIRLCIKRVKKENSIVKPYAMHKKCLYSSRLIMRIYPGSGITTETSRKPHKGLCTKNGQALMGCIRIHGKRCFLCQQQKPKLMELWIL